LTRRRLTQAEWDELWERQGGCCALCAAPLDDDPALGPTEDDHAVPHALDGGEEIDNRQLVHRACHASKTNTARPDAPLLGSDKQLVAKAKRLAKGGRKRKSKPIQGRGFNRRWRKRMDGTVEWRGDE
jgi:5-methylcytosine-specific restriction endonuclease McrA